MELSRFTKVVNNLLKRETDPRLVKVISKLQPDQIILILEILSNVSTSKLIDRNIDIFKMKYGIGYDRIYNHKLICRKYDFLHIRISANGVKYILDNIKLWLISIIDDTPFIDDKRFNIKNPDIMFENKDYASIKEWIKCNI